VLGASAQKIGHDEAGIASLGPGLDPGDDTRDLVIGESDEVWPALVTPPKRVSGAWQTP